MRTNNQVLKEQIQYYRARAPEYDEWFYRQGRYFYGEEHTKGWFSEVAIVEKALMDAKPGGQILEFACGTGVWTEKIAPLADKMTAIDTSPEVIAICQKKLKTSPIEFMQHDIFDWVPQQQYDFIFFGFWLSHVPLDSFDAFWELVRSSIKPTGHVFFVDSAFAVDSSAKDNRPVEKSSGIVDRILNNGDQYQIVKIFHKPDELKARLSTLGWSGYVRKSDRFFIYGSR
jgi:demethylmenaquinone methyltransferase/2-methoxy-6-polyprenyl-1,4-benzoquinol methylase